MASKFEYYLRTGRRSRLVGSPIETKFNPWHDPEDGRFTFVGRGRFFSGGAVTRRRTGDQPFSGNRGGYGGGGATESWDGTAVDGSSGTPPTANHHPPKPTIAVTAPTARPKATTIRQQTRLTFNRNGYGFAVDAHARPRRVSGELRLRQQPRSKRAQANAGKPDRRDTDDGGHFIAARFNGPRDWFNHFAQDSNFNRSGYSKLENEWARAIQSGKRVFVDIVPYYRGSSMRPYKLRVVWKVGGRRQSKDFQNEKGSQ